MKQPRSDAFAFFGASGDLAYKKIFPALYAMTRRGHLDLPVIGVPLTSSTSVAGGLDALLSIAQMPPGVPVACVGLDNARNAGHLAARILST